MLGRALGPRARSRAARAPRHPAPGDAAQRQAVRRGDAAPVPIFYERGRTRRRGARARRARAKRGAGSASSPAGRSSGSRSPARWSAGPSCCFSTSRRPGSIRSRAASCGTLLDAVPSRGRHDPADDALHGRGREALRPRRHRRSRQGHRARHAARADRRRSAPSTSSSSRWPTAAPLDGRRSARAARRQRGATRERRLVAGASEVHLAVPALLARARGPGAALSHCSRRTARRSRTCSSRSPAGTCAMRDRGGADPPLLELTLARLREFLREPEALFWVFVFPVIMAFALGHRVPVAQRRHRDRRRGRGPGARSRCADAASARRGVEVRALAPERDRAGAPRARRCRSSWSRARRRPIATIRRAPRAGWRAASSTTCCSARPDAPDALAAREEAVEARARATSTGWCRACSA